jgi:hypothetical protein
VVAEESGQSEAPRRHRHAAGDQGGARLSHCTKPASYVFEHTILWDAVNVNMAPVEPKILPSTPRRRAMAYSMS